MKRKRTTIIVDKKYIELLDGLVKTNIAKSYGDVVEKLFNFWLEINGEAKVRKLIKERSKLLKELWEVP